MSDEGIVELRRDLYAMAELALDVYFETKKDDQLAKKDKGFETA